MDDAAVARFLETYPATTDEALSKIRAACRSFVDFGAKATELAEASEPTTKSGSPDEGDATDGAEPPVDATDLPAKSTTDSDGSATTAATPDLHKQEQDTRLVDAVASLIEQQAEQTRATRQLVDALSDLTNQLHGGGSGGAVDDSGNESALDAPDAGEEPAEVDSRVMDEIARGFAERLRRDLFNNPRTE
jgi:hypothetical protein